LPCFSDKYKAGGTIADTNGGWLGLLPGHPPFYGCISYAALRAIHRGRPLRQHLTL